MRNYSVLARRFLFEKHKDFSIITIQIILFYLLYYIYFGRFYINGLSFFVGDSAQTLSLNALATYSLVKNNQFLWWDPTSLNGWPVYINLSIGWFNYLAPFSLPGNLFNYFFVNVLHGSVVEAVRIQFTSVTYLLSLTMVILLSRQLILSTIGRLIPPLIFTLGASTNHLHNLIHHGPPLVPTLFYFFGIIYFFNNRNVKGLYIFLISVVTLLASANYIITSSALFPLFVFTIIFFFLNKTFVLQSIKILQDSLKSTFGKVIFSLFIITFCFSIYNIYMPLYFLEDEIIRVGKEIGSAPFDYSVKKLAGHMVNSGFGWSFGTQKTAFALNQWAPFDDIYPFALMGEPTSNLFATGNDMRYIGIFTLPLMFAALIYSRRTHLMAPLFLTYFICAFVLPYTAHLPLLQYALDHIPMMRNIRCMAHFMPKDSPTIFAALIAGMGFDAIFITRNLKTSKIFIPLIFFLLGLAFLAGCALFISHFQSIKDSLAHIAVYLCFSLLVLLAIIVSPKRNDKKFFAIIFLGLIFSDLTISSSYYWLRMANRFWVSKEQNAPRPEDFGALNSFEIVPGKDISYMAVSRDGAPWTLPDGSQVNVDAAQQIWVKKPDQNDYTTSWEQYEKENGLKIKMVVLDKNHSLAPKGDGVNLIFSPEAPVLLPDKSEVVLNSNGEVWVKKPDQGHYATPWQQYVKEKNLKLEIKNASTGWYRNYGGALHGFKNFPSFGFRSWLVLFTRPAWRPILENLDFNKGELTSYPVFHFYNSATYVPFDHIYNLDTLKPPYEVGTTIYIHDKSALEGLSNAPKVLDVKKEILTFTPNKVKLSVDMPEEGLMYYVDSFDRFWEARVNGIATEVYRANFNFKAIRLPSGKSIVEWKYNPYPIKYGWIAFYLFFIATLGSMAYFFLRRR